MTVLRGNLKRQGYISEVKSVISEFTQYDIGEEELDRMMEQAGEGTSLYYKLSDLKKVYEGFYAYLEEKYITREEILDLLCERVPQSAILRTASLRWTALPDLPRFRTGCWSSFSRCVRMSG